VRARGAEVIPLLNAMSQGNDGSLATVHASSSRQAFTRLATYAVQAPERLTFEASAMLISGCCRLRGASRLVDQRSAGGVIRMRGHR
jgi:Flp pilus assembly CpaF family ATPase